MIRPGTKTRLLLAIAALATVSFAPAPVRGSDHADTAENANRQGADMTDVFIFPSATAGNVVLVMDTHGIIPAGAGGSVFFDPNVLYQIKIDNTGDGVEDLVIQAKFFGIGPNQQFQVAGPIKPTRTGQLNNFTTHYPSMGSINSTTYAPNPAVPAMKVFAGVRSEPFFFDLNAFIAIFPDRGTPLTGMQVNLPNPDAPQKSSFRGFPNDANHPFPPFDHSPAMDFFLNLNVMSIVVDLPRTMLAPAGGTPGVIGVWETTSIYAGGTSYLQQDRLARPAINEALATVSTNPALGAPGLVPRHETNNKANPTDDVNRIALDIQYFTTQIAGRSQGIANFLEMVLVPDVMKADLSQSGTANYLGVETAGKSSPTGSKFGGRALTDDVIDVDLMAVFGPLIPMLVPALEDGRESPQYATDNIGPHTDYLSVFPYLGNPH